MSDAFEILSARLDAAKTPYGVIDHEPEGQTEAVSLLRNHPLTQAAKCIMLIVKTGKKHTRFVLGVVRGDGRVDTNKVRTLFGATYVGFAAVEVAERLARAPTGAVLPFRMSEQVTTLVDTALLQEERFYFNAGRLDRSMWIRPDDYLAFEAPQVVDLGRYEA